MENHTKEKPTDKRTCVRVNYSGQYHVDLPIYGTYKNELYLAEKEKQNGTLAIPRLLKLVQRRNREKKEDQIRHLVKYIKAWADYNSKSGKLPSGFVLTILITECYEKSDRDDASFAGTAKSIYDRLKISEEIRNPVDPKENLRDRISDSKMVNFKESLETLLNNASLALKEKSERMPVKVEERIR